MMKPRLFLFILAIAFIFTGGCVKESYDMTLLSKKGQISPTLAAAVAKGNVSLSDMVKQSDTVVFDADHHVKLIFKSDSVIKRKMDDFVDFSNVVTFSQTYTLGDLSIDPFQGSLTYTLDEISSGTGFPPAVRTQLIAFDDGAPHQCPAFSPVTLVEKDFIPFSNFATASFRTGFIDISVKNNLPAPLNDLSIQIYNTADHMPVGSAITVTSIPVGFTRTVAIDISGLTFQNKLTANIILSGSPGNTTPAVISMTNNGIRVTITGHDLKVKSGRAVLPLQNVSSVKSNDTVTFNPGHGMEIVELKTLSGNMEYNAHSNCAIGVALRIKLSDVLQADIPFVANLNLNPNSSIGGSFDISNTVFYMGNDHNHPYNRVPMENILSVNSGGALVDFDSQNSVDFEINIANPSYDYVRGYFGQLVSDIKYDRVDLKMKNVLKHISGSIKLTDPVVRMSYNNSFAMPILLTLNSWGIRNNDSLDLGFTPVDLDFPIAPASRKISSSFLINKDNSSLAGLLSMPPEFASYYGNVKMNPSGNTGLRDNYFFGDSSNFTASMEVEVPLDMKLNDFQFSDTVKNFIKGNLGNSDSPVNPQNLSTMRMILKAKNGFPTDASVSVSLYDTISKTIKSTILATDLLKASPTNANGKSTGATETKTTIDFTKEFINSADSTDRIIFTFTLKTPDNGTKAVMIYSDNTIDFIAAVVLKSDLKFDFSDFRFNTKPE